MTDKIQGAVSFVTGFGQPTPEAQQLADWLAQTLTNYNDGTPLPTVVADADPRRSYAGLVLHGKLSAVEFFLVYGSLSRQLWAMYQDASKPQATPSNGLNTSPTIPAAEAITPPLYGAAFLVDMVERHDVAKSFDRLEDAAERATATLTKAAPKPTHPPTMADELFRLAHLTTSGASVDDVTTPTDGGSYVGE